jgi:cytidine deaminase
MQPEDMELIELARAVRGRFGLREGFSAGTVAAAIRTVQGTVYTGICIDLACGLGFCAEVAAAAEMLKHRETQVDTVVAIGNGDVVLPPCGRCREMLAQIDRHNLDCRVLLPGDRVTQLSKLLPDHWLESSKDAEPSASGDAASS